MSFNPCIYIKPKTQSDNLKDWIEKIKSHNCNGVILPSFLQFRIELAKLYYDANFQHQPWKDLLIPAINVMNSLQEQLDLAFYLQLRFVYLEIGEMDPEKLAKQIKIKEYYKGFVLVGMSMNDNDDSHRQWHKWQKFIKAMNFHPKIKLALSIHKNTPSIQSEVTKRWLAEDIDMLVIPHLCFESDGADFFMISSKLQNIIQTFLQYSKCSVGIELNFKVEHKTLQTLIKRVNDVASKNYPRRICTMKYANELYFPLEPLHDNLDSATYEDFEKDPAKYVLYQKAIEAALTDKIAEEEKESKKLVLLLVGAGRGPLIRACFNAMKNTQRKMKIIVVEKNPNAVVTLSHLMEELYVGEDIELISKDMRQLNLKEKADIILSELLGSFGDNELSPECLDGAQKHLKPDGISIPAMSISFVRPVMCSLIYHKRLKSYPNHILYRNDSEANSKKYSINEEMSFLCSMTNVYYIDKAKELWRFEHPNNEDSIQNSRHNRLQFKAKINCIVHGFTGYFVAKLYKNIEISIHPATITPGLISWFPIYFPTKHPIAVKKGETISVEFWRKVKENEKVWYEWRVNDGAIANKDGEIHPISTSISM